MISRVLIMAPGGVLCYSKNFVSDLQQQDNLIEEDLVGGFLNAISSFAKEIQGGEIESLNFRNFNFLYSYDEEFGCMFVLVIDIDDLEDEARTKLELMKNEFISRYHDIIKTFSGCVSVFDEFDEFVEENIFIPPKILLVGEPGVGKTTILNLYPGETILELDEDLNEVLQKPIDISGVLKIKQVILRELDLQDLADRSKLYRPLLNTVDAIIIVTNSAASNLSRTKQLFSRLEPLVKKADFYIIANFQDLKEYAFEPKKIKKYFDGIKTIGFSANQDDSKDKFNLILKEILEKSVVEKIEKKQGQKP
jgi:GTPase SAR1 family protein